MLGLYSLCISFVLLWFTINRMIMIIFEHVASKGPYYTYNEMQQMILHAAKGENLIIRNDRYYSYNKRDNILRVKEKQEYTEYDRFACFHELGHHFDYQSKYRWTYDVIAVFKPVFLSLWFVLIIITFGIFQFPSLHLCTKYVAASEVILGGFIAFCTVPIEIHASKQALVHFSNASSKTKTACIVSAYLSVVDQVLFWLMMMAPGVFLFHFNY